MQKDKALINLAHIRKINDSYEISCEYGPLYKGLNYHLTLIILVYFGLIGECNDDTAKLIDQAVSY